MIFMKSWKSLKTWMCSRKRKLAHVLLKLAFILDKSARPNSVTFTLMASHASGRKALLYMDDIHKFTNIGKFPFTFGDHTLLVHNDIDGIVVEVQGE